MRWQVPSRAARCMQKYPTLRPGLCTGRAAWQRMCSACAAHVQRMCSACAAYVHLACILTLRMMWLRYSNPTLTILYLQVRALTAGEVRGAPLAYDALCGRAAPQDPPLLLMFMLMTRLSWCAPPRSRPLLLRSLSTPAPAAAPVRANDAPVLVRLSTPAPGGSAGFSLLAPVSARASTDTVTRSCASCARGLAALNVVHAMPCLSETAALGKSLAAGRARTLRPS